MTAEKKQKNDGMIQIDGAAIRQAREDQSLTQLYVAKMVGVTTDTISRWENNRYPTIKRPNAEKLAEALEVPLERILRQDDETPQPPVRSWRLSRRWTLVVTLLGLLSIGVTLWLWPQPPIVAERVLPSYAAPGAVFPVQLRFSNGTVRGVVREQLPHGWRFVSSVPMPDSVDEETGLVRWIVQMQDQPLTIYYLVQVDPQAALKTMMRFDGELVAHTATQRSRIELIGADQLVIQHIHWADLNADLMIDDDEMLDASYLSENMPGMALDLDAVEAMWIEDHYYWDEALRHFQPGSPTDSSPQKTAQP